MYMVSHLDRYGYICTLVFETGRLFFVNRSPLDILNDSIKKIGYDLNGALKTSKELLNLKKMCPVMVNPIFDIVVFPTKSLNHEENIWFNPHQIHRTSGYHGKTMVMFSNGSHILIPMRLDSFNHKTKIAEQLLKLTTQTTHEPLTFVLNPKKRADQKISKEKTRHMIKNIEDQQQKETCDKTNNHHD